MAYSIFINWMDEFKHNPDRWINHGRDILRGSCKHKNGVEKEDYCDECDISEDSAEPMMNYIYPLELKDFDEDKILKVVKETNCSIMENQDTGEYFLTLCGGGMDLSQDIAYSYIILEKWIPRDLLTEVCKQPLLSLGSKEYNILAKEVIYQLEATSDNFKNCAKKWEYSLKNLKESKRLELIQKELNLNVETHN